MPARAAIGTGPYRLVSYRSGDRIEIRRATTPTAAGAQPWARVSYRFVANDAARTAALLAGDVDLIDQVPSSDLARLRRDPRVTAAPRSRALRLIYLMPDYHARRRARRWSPTTPAQPLPANPFQRRARAPRAVDGDRPRRAGRPRHGGHRDGRPANGCRRASFGYNPDVPAPRLRPRRRAPPAGRGRLSAGLPHHRCIRPTTATRTMRAPPGGGADVDAHRRAHRGRWRCPGPPMRARASRQEFTMRLGGWGSVDRRGVLHAGQHLRHLRPRMPTRRGEQHARFSSNPALDALTDRAVRHAGRRAARGDAARGGARRPGRTAMIPLCQLVNFWATRRGLTYEARMDERTTAMGVRPAR